MSAERKALTLESIQLPGDGRRTSQLAMGSGRLMGATSLRNSLALLETAFEAGIRHVDTAPSYGLGQAEQCVGAFLGRHRGEVTVTTKYGIPARRGQTWMGLARGLVRPVVNLHPGIKRKLQRAAAAAVGGGPATYTVQGAEAALANSLRTLNVERIDIWLLHEATADDLGDEALLRFMEDSVRAGRIGAFGVGSEAGKIPRIRAEREAWCPIIQCEWDPLRTEEDADGFRIHHGVLHHWLPVITRHIQQDAARCRRWSEEIGVDLGEPGMPATLLVKAAMETNPRGMTLFFSKNKENIRQNAGIASDGKLAEPARRLLGMIRREGPAMQK